MADILKNCPFCGHAYPVVRHYAWTDTYKIACPNCQSEFSLDCTAGRDRIKEKVCEAWNRRVAGNEPSEPIRHERWMQAKGKSTIWHCSGCNRVVRYNPKPRCYQNTKNKLPVHKHFPRCPECVSYMDGGDKDASN